MAERILSLLSCMCVKMREGSKAPDAHAEPWLAAMPARSSWMRSVSPSIPRKERFEVLGMRGALPLITMSLNRVFNVFSK